MLFMTLQALNQRSCQMFTPEKQSHGKMNKPLAYESAL